MVISHFNLFCYFGVKDAEKFGKKIKGDVSLYQ